MTDDEIAEASGLTVGHVAMIAQQTDWIGVDLPTMRKYLVGCGVDLDNRQQMLRVEKYLKSKPNWQFLRASEQWETLFRPLMVKWREAKMK